MKKIFIYLSVAAGLLIFMFYWNENVFKDVFSEKYYSELVTKDLTDDVIINRIVNELDSEYTGRGKQRKAPYIFEYSDSKDIIIEIIHVGIHNQEMSHLYEKRFISVRMTDLLGDKWGDNDKYIEDINNVVQLLAPNLLNSTISTLVSSGESEFDPLEK